MSREDRHYSVSQIQTYLGCPLKYRFQYLDHIPKAFRSGGPRLRWHRSTRPSSGSTAPASRATSPNWERCSTCSRRTGSPRTSTRCSSTRARPKDALEAKARAMLQVYLESDERQPPGRRRGALLARDRGSREPVSASMCGCAGSSISWRRTARWWTSRPRQRSTPQEDVERHLPALDVRPRLCSSVPARSRSSGSTCLLKTTKPRLGAARPRAAPSRSSAWVARLDPARPPGAIEDGHFFPNPSWRCT